MIISSRLTPVIIFCFLCVTISSCSTIYYVGQTATDVALYNVTDTTHEVRYVIPIGSTVLTRKKSKKYHYIIFEKYNGYAYKPVYLNYHRYNSTVDGELYGYSSKKKKSSSYSGSSSRTVNVKGYYRKDGTYVRPHTRSAPKRKS
jgi:hypothetical protein